MGFLGRGGDVVDLTDLHKRGVLKRAAERDALNREPANANDVVDLSSMGINNMNSSPVQSQSEASVSPLSFFDNPSPSPQATSFFDNPVQQSAPLLNVGGDKDISAMRIRMEDVEYRLDKFIERMDQLENKITELLRNAR